MNAHQTINLFKNSTYKWSEYDKKQPLRKLKKVLKEWFIQGVRHCASTIRNN